MIAPKIRNLCIIAHVDHGKSTLADRLMQFTKAISDREMTAQYLDSMNIERERGITIKAQTVSLSYKAKDSQTYQINFIDTPGHVDFSYEVSRSIQACEGALLLVDASQGIEAQTMANSYIAIDNNLEIIPILNKIDLPSAEPERITKEIEDVVGIPTDNLIACSAKKSIGIEETLEAIVRCIPPPKGDPEKPLQALIFDSWFDSFLGVIALVRIVEGTLKPHQKIYFMEAKKTYTVTQLGKFYPQKKEVSELQAGEVGFLAASIKNVDHIKIGDTVTLAEHKAPKPLPGYKKVQAMVFSGLYPVDSNDFARLQDALAKLRLNDSSFQYEPESSMALGLGFRCGFLGLLHMEIVQERLEREFNLNLLVTSPTISLLVYHKKKGKMILENPSKMPSVGDIDYIEEPFVLASICTPEDYTGAVIGLCIEKRGVQKDFSYIGKNRVCLQFELPLSEIVVGFFDQLKSVSKGYASLDYDFLEYRKSQMVKLDLLLNGKEVDALSVILHKDKAYYKGRYLTKKLKEIIPRQMYEVALQAAIGSRIIARETLSALKKNVTAKCYGGDITRKRKLWEKQKKGKKRMKKFGAIDVPQEAFIAIAKE
jgi:GTP-binding protein LepA